MTIEAVVFDFGGVFTASPFSGLHAWHAERGQTERVERDPQPVVQAAAPEAVEPRGGAMLRDSDGGASHAPAFLQARPVPASAAAADADVEKPVRVRRRKPKAVEAGEGPGPSETEDA